jgi:molecular chaperone GrpE
VLGDFRSWLQHAAEAAEPPPPVSAEPSIDVASVLNHFVALRHEVNLQTKAVRAQQEQNAEVLQQLRQALDTLAQVPRARPQAQDAAEAQRPLLKTLIDVHDALSLASREMPKLRDAVAPLFQILADSDKAPAAVPWWRRWLGPSRRAAAPARPGEQANAAAEQIRALLESFRAGYAMGLQRVERALAQHGLEAIPTLGCPFDPEEMEVMDVAAGAGRPAGEVLAEIRTGYRWHGRVFRYAQVQVARD